ncbi:phosphatase PAP2 family protein [Kitasatospora acidiphila]|uniref:Phosphatase PAP2 family protein n=1 Tax=Kitasatospora acidiphila TaxID=2567942 RepID=A0A540W9Y3_9ACTN|nr:phosphatase PAP2 family protein [Kitasatospora acidiphila]
MGESTIHVPGSDDTAAPRHGDSVQTPGGAAAEAANGTGGSTAVSSADSLRHRIARARRRPKRPRLWFEIALMGITYWLYNIVRNAIPQQDAIAQRHATWVWHTEQDFGISIERWVNHTLDKVGWLITGMNYYYATLHFIVTLAVLIWLYRSHPGRYAAARLVLAVTTIIALVGFYLFPLAPPRLMNGGGFVDTVITHHTWGSLASGAAASVTNKYAAMPSMHIGWSMWCGLSIFFLAERTWVRALGLAYPAATLVVIIATANHFWMDAVGGAACLAVGFLVARLVYHRWAFQFPQIPASWQAEAGTLPEQRPTPVGVKVSR